MNDTLQELRERLANAEPGRVRVDILLELAEQVFYNDVQEALDLNERAERESQELEYSEGRSQSLLQQSYCLHRLARHAEALKMSVNCRMLASRANDGKGEANAWKLTGDIHHEIGNLKDALDCYRESVRLAEQLSDRKFLASVLVSLAKSYSDLEDIVESETQYMKALDIFRAEEHRQGEAVCLNNLGALVQESGNYAEALDYLKKALTLAQSTGFEYLELNTLLLMGICRYRAVEYEKAKKRLQECLRIAQRTSNSLLELDSHLYLGKIALAESRYTDALEHCSAAGQIAHDISAKQREIDLALLASEIYSALGQSDKALEQYRRFHELDREVLSAEARRTSANLRMQMDIEKEQREAEIHRLRNVELAGALKKLESANRDLRQLDMEKSEFLSFAAHDLRNPLIAIHNDAKSLNADFDFMDNDDILAISGRVESSAEQMLALIASLLDINRIEMRRSRLAIVDVDWYERVKATIDLFANTAAKKNIALQNATVAGEYMVRADAGALLQICENLISNAIKFSPLETRVTIALDRGDGVVRFSVRDQGPGLTEEDRRSLFGKFKRLSARPTGGEESTGLGLAIVKKLCDEMAGRVWCASEVGSGACFMAELPAVSGNQAINEAPAVYKSDFVHCCFFVILHIHA